MGSQLKLMDPVAVPQEEPKKETQNAPKNTKKNAAAKKSGGQKFKRLLKEMVSELKKVAWPKWKKSKNNPGVFDQTGVVLMVVLFFTVIVSLFDLGLGQLLKLLVAGA